MTKAEFRFLLSGASYEAAKFAKEYIKNDLSFEFVYDVQLNVSNDNPDLLKQFNIYPEDNERQLSGLTEEEVVDLLWRDGKVPVWIDINVKKSNKKITTLSLSFSGRYSDDNNEFYYIKGGSGPFGIKSPVLPPVYKEGKKFRIEK